MSRNLHCTIWLAVLLLGSSTALAEAYLRVKPHVVVSPNIEVRISQLIDSQGLSTELMKKLSEIAISVSPAYGEKHEIANANITLLLRPLVQEERARTKEQIHLVVPKSVIIDTTKRSIDRTDVLTELMQVWQPLCSDCKLEVESLSLPIVGEIRDWSLQLKAELPRGGFSIPVQLIRENGSAAPAWISGRLVVKRKVPVAVRLIAMNERVSEKDFTWEYRDTSYSIDGIPSNEDITGRRLRQGLRVNDVLWKTMLEREHAVRRGDVVQLRAAEGVWEVTVNMIAQEDAYIGDVINLRNARTKAVLMGKVTGQGEVELR